MADNVLVANDDQTDYTVATDDDGTAQHQYTKIEWGADGTFTKVATGANAVPIQDGGNSITVDGTLAVTQSGTWDEIGINDSGNSITVDDGSGSLTVDNSSLSVVGGGTEATAMRVTVASDSTGVLSVDDNGSSLTVDGTVAVSGLSGTVAVTQSGTWDEIGINDSGNSITVDGTIAATQSGTWTVQPGNTANTTAWKVDGSAVTQPVSGTVTATPTGTYTTKETRAATSALTTVSDTASSTSILAANSNRLKAVVTNDSSARLYLRFEAAAASTSNYMVSLGQHETWEELDYTGEIRGIWATDPNDGAARVTEFTA